VAAAEVSAVIDQLNAGQLITCTIAKAPKAEGATKTIARLMRRDPQNNKALRRGQKLRRDRMHAYTRGGRTWYDREKSSKIVMVREGEQWTMAFTHDIAPDLKSVESYLTLAKA
jgi:hypothetical protein